MSHLALHVAQAVYKIQGSFCASVVTPGHVPCEESYILSQRAWLWERCFPSVENEEQVYGRLSWRLGSQSSSGREPRRSLAFTSFLACI